MSGALDRPSGDVGIGDVCIFCVGPNAFLLIGLVGDFLRVTEFGDFSRYMAFEALVGFK